MWGDWEVKSLSASRGRQAGLPHKAESSFRTHKLVKVVRRRRAGLLSAGCCYFSHGSFINGRSMSSLPPRPLFFASILVFAVSLMLLVMPLAVRMAGTSVDSNIFITLGMCGMFAVQSIFAGTVKMRKWAIGLIAIGLIAAVIYGAWVSFDQVTGNFDFTGPDRVTTYWMLGVTVVSFLWLLAWVVQRKHAEWFVRTSVPYEDRVFVAKCTAIFLGIAIVFGLGIRWRTSAREIALFPVSVEVAVVDDATGSSIDDVHFWRRAYSVPSYWSGDLIPKMEVSSTASGKLVEGVSDRPMTVEVSAPNYRSKKITLDRDTGRTLTVRLEREGAVGSVTGNTP